MANNEKNVQIANDLYNLGVIGGQMLAIGGGDRRGEVGYEGVARKLQVLAQALNMDKNAVYSVIEAKESVRGVRSRITGNQSQIYHQFNSNNNIATFNKNPLPPPTYPPPPPSLILSR